MPNLINIDKESFVDTIKELTVPYRIRYFSDTNNNRIRPHEHNFYEVYFLREGMVSYHIKGDNFLLQPGDVLCINQGQMHMPVVLDKDSPYERIVLQVDPDFLSELSSSQTNLHTCFQMDDVVVYRFPPEVLSDILEVLKVLFNIQEKQSYGDDLMFKAYLTVLFVTINNFNQHKANFHLGHQAKEKQFLSIIDNYIKAHIGFEISIDDLAELVFLSRRYFMQIFKELTGQTAYEYVQRRRVQHAISLIKDGQSLSQAAINSGFKNYSSFYRYFKKLLGQSPSDYIKAQQL